MTIVRRQLVLNVLVDDEATSAFNLFARDPDQSGVHVVRSRNLPPDEDDGFFTPGHTCDHDLCKEGDT